MVQVIHQQEATIIDTDHATCRPSQLVILILQCETYEYSQLQYSKVTARKHISYNCN
jgi:hypothetical protein